MGETATLPAPAAPRHDEWRDRRWRLTGLALVVVWVAVVVAALLVAEKQQTLTDLEQSLANGSVSDVELTQPDYDAGPRIPVVLRWREHGLRRWADVTVRPAETAPASRPDVITGDPVVHLERLGADVTTTLGSPADIPVRSSWSLRGVGWTGPGWFGGLVLGAWVASFLTLGFGPEPWRATRWGWGWFVLLAGPFGAMAYVLLGGPLGLPRPRNPHRRLTGGWAFLLAFVLLGGSQAG